MPPKKAKADELPQEKKDIELVTVRLKNDTLIGGELYKKGVHELPAEIVKNCGLRLEIL